VQSKLVFVFIVVCLFVAEFLGKETRELIKDPNDNILGIKLTITGATFENTGNYECSAENQFGKAMEVSTLTVNKVFGSGGGASFDEGELYSSSLLWLLYTLIPKTLLLLPI
jgi:hypothetical protein